MEIDSSEEDDEFIPQMPSLTPPDVEIQPTFGQESSELNPLIVGRLLTPAEGCGTVAVSNKRIVGGSPAKNGMKKHHASAS